VGKKGEKVKQLKTSPKDALDAYNHIETALHHLNFAKFLLRYSPKSKCYKSICDALSSLECYKAIQDKVVTNFLEEDKNNDFHHLDDKNSHT